jgi:hypothetical protein
VESNTVWDWLDEVSCRSVELEKGRAGNFCFISHWLKSYRDLAVGAEEDVVASKILRVSGRKFCESLYLNLWSFKSLILGFPSVRWIISYAHYWRLSSGALEGDNMSEFPFGELLIWFGWLVGWLVYSCSSHLEHRTSVKRFVSLQFLNLRLSVGLLGPVISPSQGRYLTRTQ